ncbi:hypothetical protein SARC_00205 [Sphaeroforma arctica JP610]|uniref:Grh/CP2 DB domain-containing protein n=1 Tax=Sphaeroforma arctica JP610 TaxID=667725 RepID=A0A0L0GFS9_9EUKA|nr:hypothetical protein SARC_00205 [Sphaeroforma arctica JP610]KNC87699.1 hypothetical protein SARC_00205 [Sphaeroforma arctica JP610]|eukprot:XP_014161601.1 hypothetical protein SARC_00205 [Sphaeroforma arctica JP610]
MRVAAQLLEDTKQEPPDSVFQGYEPVQFFLDAPNSIARKLTDGALSYLNVGLVYNISAKKIPGNTVGSDPVHTIISLLIDGKDDNSVVHWEQWQKTCAAQFNMNSANHPHSGAKIGMTSAPTRPINALATKAQGITNLTKPRINSLSFYWTPSEGFKLPIQVYCLSTDFVTQKGVAGMPFKIQVDILNAKSTGTESLYRSQCLIKVFRPNGAERKHKEESKSEEKRLLKHMKKSGPAVFTNPFFQESKYTTFTSIPALGPPPVQFADKPLDSLPLVATGDVMGVLSEFNIDSTMFTETQAHRDKRQYISSPVSAGEEHPNSNATSEGRRSQNYCGSPGAAKKAWSRPADYTTLYLKIEDEEAYHAIYLYEKDLDELKLKIAQRYHKSAENIRKIYKRTKKGILVNVDSEMVARIEDESDFILTLKEDPVTSADSFYCIICPNFGDPIPSSTKRQSKKRLSSSHSSASRSSSIKSLSPPVIANTDLLDENHDESD